MRELTKSEKKVARMCIDKGLDAEYREGLEKVAAIMDSRRSGKFKDSREAYLKMYKTLDGKDREIARRYNGLTGSRYLLTVAVLFADGYIDEDDIRGFSDSSREAIYRFKDIRESDD